jgi:hypothetical protein
MSDCLHCDINDLVQKYIEGNDTADATELVAKVVESLVDLIISVTPESEQAKLIADALAHFGQVYLEKSGAVEGGSVATH